MIRRALIWLFMAGGLLLSGGITIAEAGEPVFTKATDIYAMAEKAVQAVDKNSRIIRAEYHWGRPDLTFRTGEFVFNVPRLKNAGGKRSSMRITVRDGKMKGVEKEVQHWVEFDPPDPDPTKAFETAGAAGLNDWLAKNKTAGLSMELILWSRSMPFKRGYSPWVWRVRSWGPDITGEYEIYLDAGNMKILGGKSAPKADDDKSDDSKKPKSDSDDKVDDSKKSKPDGDDRSDDSKKTKPDDGKADDSKQPKSDSDGKADDSKKTKPDGDKPEDSKKPKSDDSDKTDDTTKPKTDDKGKTNNLKESDLGQEKPPSGLKVKAPETVVPKLDPMNLRKK